LQDLHALRVLVAEDNSINQMVITRMLKRLGVSADLAADGDEAVRKAEGNPYDLVLMDVQMPGKDGLEATQMIRSAAGPNRRIPVLALTAHASSEEKRRCLAVGMDDFLTKPIGLVALREALERWGKPRS
jgi:CheY-like chemotaxis protein